MEDAPTLDRLERKLDELLELLRGQGAEPEPSAFMSTEETAALLGVAASTLHRWRAEGSGPPCVKMRGSLRYERTAVKAWAATR